MSCIIQASSKDREAVKELTLLPYIFVLVRMRKIVHLSARVRSPVCACVRVTSFPSFRSLPDLITLMLKKQFPSLGPASANLNNESCQSESKSY